MDSFITSVLTEWSRLTSIHSSSRRVCWRSGCVCTIGGVHSHISLIKIVSICSRQTAAATSSNTRTAFLSLWGASNWPFIVLLKPSLTCQTAPCEFNAVLINKEVQTRIDRKDENHLIWNLKCSHLLKVCLHKPVHKSCVWGLPLEWRLISTLPSEQTSL